MTMSETAWSTARTLDALRRHFKMSDAQLANRTRTSGQAFNRATVQQRRAGRSPMTLVDVDRFAEALGVPPAVLLMDAADAIRWVLDHEAEVRASQAKLSTSDQGIPSTMWYTERPARRRLLLAA